MLTGCRKWVSHELKHTMITSCLEFDFNGVDWTVHMIISCRKARDLRLRIGQDAAKLAAMCTRVSLNTRDRPNILTPGC